MLDPERFLSFAGAFAAVRLAWRANNLASASPISAKFDGSLSFPRRTRGPKRGREVNQ